MSPVSRNPLGRPSRSPRPGRAARLRLPVTPRSRRVGLACAVVAAVAGVVAVQAAPAPEPDLVRRAADTFRGMPEKARPRPGPGTTILLAGLDRRAGLSKATKNRLHVGGKQCDCTDVMMLLHVSADHRRVSVVSIPRDSFVAFAPHRDSGEGFGKDTSGRITRHAGKINSAYAHGGPSLTVRTVEQATGVRVDHYAETDFVGFVKTVDRLGGARVCTAKPLRDTNAGLRLGPGVHDLDGTRALRYARARHVDPPGDLGRVRRQQRMLEEMLTTLTDERVAGDPVALVRTARELRASVRTDSGLTLERLAELGRLLHGLRPEHTEFATVPIADFDYRVPQWGSALRWDERRARALFADLRADRPVTGNPATQPAPGTTPVAMAPGDISVRVVGTGATAERITNSLRANGFHLVNGPAAGSGGAEAPPVRTEVHYDAYWDRQASTVAAALPGAVLRPAKTTGTAHSPVFTVRLGTKGTEVARIVHDRSSVEGAPVTGDTLDCDTAPPVRARAARTAASAD